MKKLILSSATLLLIGFTAFAGDGSKCTKKCEKKCDKKECIKGNHCDKKCNMAECTPDMKCKKGNDKACAKKCKINNEPKEIKIGEVK